MRRCFRWMWRNLCVDLIQVDHPSLSRRNISEWKEYRKGKSSHYNNGMGSKPFFLRRVITRASLVFSILFSLALAGLYIRSYSFYDLPSRTWSVAIANGRADGPFAADDGFAMLESAHGSLGYFRQNSRTYRITAPFVAYHSIHWNWETLPPGGVETVGSWGFAFRRESTSLPSGSELLPAGIQTDFLISVPYWLPLSLAIGVALLSIYRLRRLRVLYRRAMGLCQRCAYDLRSSHGRCPECGLAMESNGAVTPG